MKPQQRKEALERSDALIKQMQEAKQDGEQAIEHLLNSDDPQTEEPAAQGEEGEATGQEDKSPPAAEQDEPRKREQESTRVEQTDGVSKAEYDRLEHAHRVLQGKYNAEIQPLHEQIRQMRERLAELESNKETPTKDTSVDEIREKLLDEFPEDVVDAMLKLGQQRQHQPDPDLKDRLDKLEVMTRQRQLEQAVPDWAELQAHPDWIPYLQERNSESGLERNDHLRHAWAHNNLKPVQAIFDGFRSRIKQAPPKPSTDKPPVEPQSRSSAPRTSPDQKQFSEREISEFYSHLGKTLDIRDPKVRALRDQIEEFIGAEQKARR